jgi:hypothetical protein
LFAKYNSVTTEQHELVMLQIGFAQPIGGNESGHRREQGNEEMDNRG